MPGLTVKQIRKLGKGPYTDNQIIKTAHGSRTSDDIVRSGDAWWTNGSIVLFEPAPEGAKEARKDAEYKIQAANAIGRWIAGCKTEVYPVEIIPLLERRAIRFENANGARVTFDARYVAAMLTSKRAGKGQVRWYTDLNPTLPVLLAVNGRRIGLVAGVQEAECPEGPEWNFRYTGPLPS